MAKWLDTQVLSKRQWTDQHFSLRLSAPGYDFRPGQFVRIGLPQHDGEVLARPYSVVNPPGEDELEIFFNIVPQGPLSPQLARLEPGDALKLSPRPNGFLTIDEVPFAETACKHLWMLATGTGVGPFLSMLQSAHSWQHFERLVLVYSVRTAQQLAYRDLIEGITQQRAEQFHFVPVVTRERVAGALHQRLTTALETGELEQRAGLQISPQTSHVMMCGNSTMIREAMELLGQRGLKKHLRRDPGHISTEKYH